MTQRAIAVWIYIPVSVSSLGLCTSRHFTNKVAHIYSDNKWSHSCQIWQRHKLWLSESRIDIVFM